MTSPATLLFCFLIALTSKRIASGYAGTPSFKVRNIIIKPVNGTSVISEPNQTEHASLISNARQNVVIMQFALD